MAKFKPRFGRGSGKRHPVDVHVGGRVKQRRKLLGMTQTDLGDALGLSFQQVQKNERGVNRIGASRLCELSRVLDVPIIYFFEGMPPEVAAIPSATKGRGKAKKLPGYESTAQLFAPEQHDSIWEVQREMDFPGTVFGVSRGVPQGETIRRYAMALRDRHSGDTVLEGGAV